MFRLAGAAVMSQSLKNFLRADDQAWTRRLPPFRSLLQALSQWTVGLGRLGLTGGRPKRRVCVAVTMLAVTSVAAEPTESSSQKEKVSDATFVAKSFRSEADGSELLYRLYVPEGVEGKLPLVLFLHGAGERGDDNRSQLKHGIRELVAEPMAERFPAIIVAPQCPAGEKWVEVDWSKKESPTIFPDSLSEPMRSVFQVIDGLVNDGLVDTSRMYVTGLSMGGYGSWYAAGLDPNRFAAMLAVCGGGDTRWADRYDGVALWAVHGDADSAVPVTRSRDTIAAIAQAGHSGELRYTELPGVGHDSWTATYADPDTWRWLFKQRRP